MLENFDLNDPTQSAFESIYLPRFQAVAARFGAFIEYKRDVAAIDLGLHLTSLDKVTNTRVWFQFKGIHTSTLSQQQFEDQGFASRSIKVKHLRAWYKSAEPVYLVYYIESADIFVAEDVRTIVDRDWGDEILNSAMFADRTADDPSVDIKISKMAQISQDFWQQLYSHRSMRVDGRSFRGRPLGHSHDPLSSTLRIMKPELFRSLVDDLLAEHSYKVAETLDVTDLFPGAERSGNVASLTCGMLHQKYEIVLQITNEIVPDEDGFRIEGNSYFAHGLCAVLTHSYVTTSPDAKKLAKLADVLLKKNIRRLLVFVNAPLLSDGDSKRVEAADGSTYHLHPGHGDLGTYRYVLSNTGLDCVPQHLEDIGFSLCITTNTYHRFRDRVSWWGHKLWAKEEGPFFILPNDGGPPIPFE